VGRTVIATVRTGIPDRSEPSVGGKCRATSGGFCRKRRKRGFRDVVEPLETFDFGIESSVSYGKKRAVRHPAARSCPRFPVVQAIKVTRIEHHRKKSLELRTPIGGVVLSNHYAIIERLSPAFDCPSLPVPSRVQSCYIKTTRSQCYRTISKIEYDFKFTKRVSLD
jgi:hypothetical protein